jgi:hypothetical protein
MEPKAMPFKEAQRFNSINFVELRDQDEFKLNIFTAEQLTDIRERCLTPTRKNAGEGLRKRIDAYCTHRMRMEECLDRIREILDPNRVSGRQSVDAILQSKVNGIAETYKMFNETQLRKFAENVLGDLQFTFTVDELPELIAKKQLGLFPLEGNE